MLASFLKSLLCFISWVPMKGKELFSGIEKKWCLNFVIFISFLWALKMGLLDNAKESWPFSPPKIEIMILGVFLQVRRRPIIVSRKISLYSFPCHWKSFRNKDDCTTYLQKKRAVLPHEVLWWFLDFKILERLGWHLSQYLQCLHFQYYL